MNKGLVGLAVAGVVLVSACTGQPSTVSPAPATAAASPGSSSPSVTPTTPTTSSPGTASASASSAGIASVTVDDLMFTVLSVETRDLIKGRNGIDSKGHWLAVRIRVTNRGKSGIAVNNTTFELDAKGGKSYQTDDPAMFQSGESDALVGEDIRPDASAEGVLLFSVPKTASGFSLKVWKPRSSSDPGVIPLGV